MKLPVTHLEVCNRTPTFFTVQCFQLSDIIILVRACRKEMSHQTM